MKTPAADPVIKINPLVAFKKRKGQDRDTIANDDTNPAAAKKRQVEGENQAKVTVQVPKKQQDAFSVLAVNALRGLRHAPNRPAATPVADLQMSLSTSSGSGNFSGGFSTVTSQSSSLPLTSSSSSSSSLLSPSPSKKLRSVVQAISRPDADAADRSSKLILTAQRSNGESRNKRGPRNNDKNRRVIVRNGR